MTSKKISIKKIKDIQNDEEFKDELKNLDKLIQTYKDKRKKLVKKYKPTLFIKSFSERLEGASEYFHLIIPELNNFSYEKSEKKGVFIILIFSYKKPDIQNKYWKHLQKLFYDCNVEVYLQKEDDDCYSYELIMNKELSDEWINFKI